MRFETSRGLSFPDRLAHANTEHEGYESACHCRKTCQGGDFLDIRLCLEALDQPLTEVLLECG